MSISRPDRLQWIDESTRRDHWCLDRDDHCLYIGEYFAGGGWQAGPINQLVLDLKRPPSRMRASSRGTAMRQFKERAIEEVAGSLRRGFGKAAVESLFTFVPIPPSRLPGDADYCDRLRRALERAFDGAKADIRPLLRHKAGIVPDHERRRGRLRRRELLELMELDVTQLDRPLRPIVALFDDVLTSGKHLSVAKTRLREHLPAQAVIAVFVARVVRREHGDCREHADC